MSPQSVWQWRCLPALWTGSKWSLRSWPRPGRSTTGTNTEEPNTFSATGSKRTGESSELGSPELRKFSWRPDRFVPLLCAQQSLRSPFPTNQSLPIENVTGGETVGFRVSVLAPGFWGVRNSRSWGPQWLSWRRPPLFSHWLKPLPPCWAAADRRVLVEAAGFSLRALKDQISYFGFPDQKRTNKTHPNKQKIKTSAILRIKNPPTPPPGPTRYNVPTGFFQMVGSDHWFALPLDSQLDCGAKKKVSFEWRRIFAFIFWDGWPPTPWLLSLKKQWEHPEDPLGFVALW